MSVSNSIIRFSIEKPKQIALVIVLFTMILGALIPLVKVDTDPENMLAEDEAVRVFHDQTKKEFSLNDVVVVGVVNEKDRDGVFNPATLKKVFELTNFAKDLADPKNPDHRVVTRDVIAPSTVDAIRQAGLGQVRFEWLMQTPPQTRAQALEIKKTAMGNPLLNGTMVAEDGNALAIYLPITSKEFAYQLRNRLLEKIETFKGDEKFYITGLPVAEDTFGVEMFIQMAISAPLAMLAIFVLMLLFFKKVQMIISPMVVATVSVIGTMGLLIGTGHTLHIMSSMIPIFLMPIAVVDSIHILSEFFDNYQRIKNRRKTLEHVMQHLFMPMLYTSLTSAAGFASLALTPIPPVRAFGLFVAIGIMLAWFLTIIFIPAYIMMMKEKRLAGFGATNQTSVNMTQEPFLTRGLKKMGKATYLRAKLIVLGVLVTLGIAGYGISQIQINDNPVKWFKADHPIRVADRVLNQHFGGTYEAYLVLEGNQSAPTVAETVKMIESKYLQNDSDLDSVVSQNARLIIKNTASESTSADQFITTLVTQLEVQMEAASDEHYDAWEELISDIEQIKNRHQVFKTPEMLRYIEKLQAFLIQSGTVGKSNSISDVVKKVYQELFEGKPEYFKVPDTVSAVAQSLISFQNSHKPDDLWHLVTPDYTKANIWLQLKSGDNQDMEKTIAAVDRFLTANPPPTPLIHNWAGLTYINVVWQDKMVTGMLESFLSSFVVVFVMMALLFRSVLWGLLAMVPLSVTIAFIYGLIGIVGKDYDMPVAVLSSLTLGLAVDFAIHFLERSRSAYAKAGSWQKGIRDMFEEPARAIARNVIVVAVGFTPLLAAPLVPYQTVGIFLASIMAVSGMATMVILPALITLFSSFLFKKTPIVSGSNQEAQVV